MGLKTWIRRRHGKAPDPGLAEAEAARARAGADRQEGAARRPEVAAVVGRLRAHVARNGFAEIIEHAFRGGA